MNSYFITPFAPDKWESPPDFQINVDEYLEALRKRWPRANIIQLLGQRYMFRWQLEPQDIDGGIQSNRQVVSFGRGPSFFNFIIWHRTFISNAIQLFLSYESSLEGFELRPDVTEQDIRAWLKWEA